MTSFRETSGLPILRRDSAEQIGQVRHYSIADGSVSAIHVGGTTADGLVIGWADVSAIGEDAVIVEDEGALRAVVDEDEIRAAEGDLTMLDKRVLDDTGNELGDVVDVEFDPDTGAIESISIDGFDIDGGRLRDVGSYAVVVAAER